MHSIFSAVFCRLRYFFFQTDVQLGLQRPIPLTYYYSVTRSEIEFLNVITATLHSIRFCEVGPHGPTSTDQKKKYGDHRGIEVCWRSHRNIGQMLRNLLRPCLRTQMMYCTRWSSDGCDLSTMAHGKQTSVGYGILEPSCNYVYYYVCIFGGRNLLPCIHVPIDSSKCSNLSA